MWTLPSRSRCRPACPISWDAASSRLPPDALRILVTAAAIGRTFPLDLLAEAADATIEAVLDAVDAGLAASVLEPAREHDDDTYQFAHALLVDAVLRR